MNILYIPLDERPCNYEYPKMIGALQKEVNFIAPPKSLLNKKKESADIELLWDWIFDHATEADIAIVSVEMLVYGGLLPSRLHQDSVDTLLERLNRLKILKERNPKLNIYASNLIMRTPHYDSSEEEPDYYADFGEAIFKWAWFNDKKEREGLSGEEQSELDSITEKLPEAHLADYSQRREKNVVVNVAVVDLVKEGTIEFLSIPQDDSAPYGFTAIDQKKVIKHIIGNRLQSKVHMYPGADEVGCTLLARAFVEAKPCRPKVYVMFSSVNSEQIIPMYEDRPLAESLKAHILASGALWVDDPKEASFILAVNTAGKVMMESWDQDEKDVTYSSFRNLRFFVDKIKNFQKRGYKVAVADVAFANGGETELVHMLDEARAFDDLIAYASWNTNCNTTGTVLATSILGYTSDLKEELTYNKVYHLLEDWIYQGVIRMDMVKNYLPTIDTSYYIFNGKDKEIHQEMERRLREEWAKNILYSFKEVEIEQLGVYTPWNRMFEIGLDLDLNYKI
ncbi:DUF4127 family protein [Sediminitomix flava]|uniref:Uncharacterized protein DUF4127 n=1 Tax=Sediminitomix flava TaxID=379075 RepID=A0A315ZGD0_SEDFL|nr:DUF4127 family protein [Sediminitomix flava]PWJ43804.1 uncharacterized protein DUF4127 [Sediminitomix flava]